MIVGLRCLIIRSVRLSIKKIKNKWGSSVSGITKRFVSAPNTRGFGGETELITIHNCPKCRPESAGRIKRLRSVWQPPTLIGGLWVVQSSRCERGDDGIEAVGSHIFCVLLLAVSNR